MSLVGLASKSWRFSDPAQIYEMHDIRTSSWAFGESALEG